MKPFYLATPFTWLRIECSENRLLAIDFVKTRKSPAVVPDTDLARRIEEQLRRYCESGDTVFDLPLLVRGTPFQQKVWRALRAIPAGQVRRYGDIAGQLGSSARAVGNACRANPIPLIIPCHRVVSAAGIGGFAGATRGDRVKLKRRLLIHEGVEI